MSNLTDDQYRRLLTLRTLPREETKTAVYLRQIPYPFDRALMDVNGEMIVEIEVETPMQTHVYAGALSAWRDSMEDRLRTINRPADYVTWSRRGKVRVSLEELRRISHEYVVGHLVLVLDRDVEWDADVTESR